LSERGKRLKYCRTGPKGWMEDEGEKGAWGGKRKGGKGGNRYGRKTLPL